METITKNQLHELRFGNHKIEVYARENTTKLPEHRYGALYVKVNPKGKSSFKVLKHYVYKTENEALEFANKAIEKLKSIQDSKNVKRTQDLLVKASDFFKIGDIVVNSWGFDQTNIDFYQVISVSNRTIVVMSIRSLKVEGSMGMDCCDVLPEKDSFMEKSYRLTVKSAGRLSNPERYYYFSKWDGKPKYCSWYR